MTPSRWKRETVGGIELFTCATCAWAIPPGDLRVRGTIILDEHELACIPAAGELSRQPWLDGSFAFHRKSRYPDEQKALAFAEVFNGPVGRIVMEALFDAICMTQMTSERDLGKHDVWLYINQTIAVGEAIQARRNA